MSGGIGEIRGDLVIGADLKGLDAGEAGLRGFQEASDSASRSLGGLGKEAGGSVQATVDLGQATATLAEGIGRAAAAVGDAVVAAADYNVAITNIGTLSSETNARLGEYEQGILSVSAALGQDATNSAKAAYDALSSGIEAGKAVEFLGVAGKAATAGLTTMDSAGKALTVTLNSFNLSADQATAVSDAMFAAANVGVTTFDELAGSFGGVASIAAASGADYKETLAVLAQITTKGVGTSEAVTQMKAAFTALSKPTADVKASLEAAGFASAEAAIKQKGLAFVLDLVRQTSVDTGKPLIELVGSTEAVNAILTTTGDNASQTADKIATLQSSAGSTAAAFDLISETPAQKMAVLKSSVNNLVITLGNALLPVVGSLLDAVNPLIQGLTRFASGVLSPLSAAFSALPGPIKIVIAGMAGLVLAGIALTGVIVGLQLAFGPALAGIAASGGVAAVASVGFGTLTAAAGSLFAVLAPLLLPLAGIAAAVLLVGASIRASNAAWEEQKQVAVEAGGGFDAFAEAAARARAEAGLLAQTGFLLRDSFGAELGDELKVAGAGLKENLAEATSGFRLLWGAVTGGPKDGGSLADVNKQLATNKQVTIDAGAAFLELGTNMSPAVRESDAFQLAQARLNEKLRNGEITSLQYKAQLLDLADSTSKAAGAGAVLTTEQQRIAENNVKTLTSLAGLNSGLSDTARNSEGFASLTKHLGEEMAQNNLTLDEARAKVASYAENQQAASAAIQHALGVWSQTTEGLDAAVVASDEFQAAMQEQARAVAAGDATMVEAQSTLRNLAAEMSSTADQGMQLSSSLRAFGLSMVDPDSDAGKDLNKQIEAAAGERSKILSEMYQSEQKFHSDRAGLVNDNAQRLADAEAKAQKSIAKAERGGNAERIAEARIAAGERIAETQKENAEKLAALESGFAAEQQARKRAIAQSIIDETNAALLSGKLGADGEQRAMAILGSLRTAFGDLTAIDPMAELSVKVNAAAGQLIYGTAEASATAGQQLISTFQNMDAEMAGSAANVEAYNQQSAAAWAEQVQSVGLASQAINENALASQSAAAGSALLAEGMNASAQAAADGFAVIPPAAAGAAAGVAQADADMRAAADLTTANLQANAGARNTTREAELQQQIATGGGIREDLAASGAASQTWASQVDQSAGQAGQAHGRFAQQVQTAGQQAGQIHARMQGEMAMTGTIASGSIGGLGKTYTGAAADIQTGGQQIAKSAAEANRNIAGMGEGTTAAVAPARTSIQGLASDMQSLGDSADKVGGARVEAEEGAADAARTAGDDTVSTFQDQTKAGQQLQRQVEDLRKAFEGLPKKLDIPVTVTGLDKAQKLIQDLQKDLDRLGKGIESKVKTAHDPQDDATKKNSPMAILQDVLDLGVATQRTFQVSTAYQGTGAMGWSNQGLALQQALSGLGQGVNPFVLQAEVEASAAFQALLFDRATIAANLAATNAEVARLAALWADVGAAIDRATVKVSDAQRAIQAALSAFFTGGGLDAILAKFRELKIELGSDFFVQAGILDANTFADVQRQLAALAGEPDKQQDLWKALIDGLSNRWKVYYEQLSQEQEREKSRIEKQIRDAKHADKDADTSDLEKQLEDVNYQLDLLKDQNDDVANAFRDQTFQVGAQYDAWERVNGALEDQQKIQRDLEAQRLRAIKEAEDALKASQKSAADAENDAHDGVLANIEAEIARRKAQRDIELEQFERRIKAEERLLESRRQAEDDDHQARLAAITAEVDAEDARIEQEEGRIDRANTLLDIFKNGITPLTQEQKDYLAGLGIDVESLTRANSGLAETKSLLDQINKAISDLPDDKPTRGTLSESQKAALQKALDQGLIDPKDRRVVEVALAGRSVRLDKIRSILEGTTGHLEDQTQQQEDQASLAENILKDLKLQLDLRKQNNDETRAALEGDIEAENKRHELAKAHLGDELAALREQQAALKQKWDDELSALDQAKKAEEDRHKARMKQLQEEYALELLKLGKTDEEIQGILAEQAQRAKTIAEEAQRRFDEWMKEVERLRQEAAARESQAPPASPEPPPPPPSQTPGQEPITAPAPGLPGLPPGPIPPPTTDSFLMNTLADAIELKSVMTDLAALGFKAPNNFTVNQNTVNNNQRTFGDVTVLEGSDAEEALLDALGRR